MKGILYYIPRITASIVGTIAGLLGAMHGYFEILNSNTVMKGILIDSKTGKSISMELIAAGQTSEPTMTIIPSFLITGIFAIVFSLMAIIWAVFFIEKKKGGLILILLSMILFLFGGGLLPPAIGIVAGIVGMFIRKRRIQI